MNLLKNFFNNNSTVIGLCELKRRQALNSFTFGQQIYFSQPVFDRPQPVFVGQKLY